MTYCDNTDCKGSNSDDFIVILKKDFEYSVIIWCNSCCHRDADMIEKQYIFTTTKNCYNDHMSNILDMLVDISASNKIKLEILSQYLAILESEELIFKED